MRNDLIILVGGWAVMLLLMVLNFAYGELQHARRGGDTWRVFVKLSQWLYRRSS